MAGHSTDARQDNETLLSAAAAAAAEILSEHLGSHAVSSKL